MDTKYVLLFFPNSKQNAAIFPNAKGPKKGCESPVMLISNGVPDIS